MPTTNQILNVLTPLIEIGCDIEGANGHYQQMMAIRLMAIGKPVNELTIREVQLVLRAAKADFEELCNRGIIR